MKKLLLSLCLMLTAVASWAVKAYPEPIVVTQSDGSQLTVIGYGDEDFHWYTSSDGVILSQIGSDFFVAAIDENGLMKATEQLAHDPNDRREAEKQLIAKQKPHRAAFFNHATTRKKAAMQRRIPIGTATPSYFPHTGEPRAMVILVQFSDLSFVVKDPVASFNDYLNAEGRGQMPDRGLYEYLNYGSVQQYFTDMSDGLFRPKFDIFGPVTMPKEYGYYGKDEGSTKDKNLNELIKEACKAIDDEVDFSQYDSDGDGYVDLVYIIYAGYSQSMTGNPDNCIWPKSGASNLGKYDGVNVSRYGVNNELNRTVDSTPTIINGIGLFCHEFSHTLGLPDIYPTNSAAQAVDNQALEYWDLMDNGEYTDLGYVPTPYTPWEKEVMGWAEIEELTDTAQITLTEDKYYKITSETNGEYLILQNFQNKRWAQRVVSTAIKCHGMLVYRIDYTNDKNVERKTVNLNDYPNNTAGKPGITLAPADGLLISSYRVYGSDPSKKTDKKPYSSEEYRQSHASDPYPGTLDVTQLLSVQMNRCVIEKPIYNIKEENGIITFDYLKDYSTLAIDIVSQENATNTEIFDLQGRKMAGNDLNKGIYIKNGKKFVVK